MRVTGIAAECFGWGGLVLAGLFWPGVCLIYAGFLVLVIDVWLEHELRPYPFWRLAIASFLVLLAIGFSWLVVFVAAPLNFGAIVTDATYPTGTSANGLRWRPEFTELQIILRNPTDHPYEDMRIYLKPPIPIVAIVQSSSIDGVYFEDKDGLTVRYGVIDLGSRRRTAIHLDLIATNAGYYVHCARLAPNATLKIEIALADIKPPTKLKAHYESAVSMMEDPSYWQRLNFSSGDSYWLGHMDGAAFLPRRRISPSESIFVQGNYTAALRTRTIEEKVPIYGEFDVHVVLPDR
jgi:hypothetical protein